MVFVYAHTIPQILAWGELIFNHLFFISQYPRGFFKVVVLTVITAEAGIHTLIHSGFLPAQERHFQGYVLFPDFGKALTLPKKYVQGNLVNGTMDMQKTIQVDLIMKKEFSLPAFNNEDEERDFWANIDLSDYFEPEDFSRVSFPNLKSTLGAAPSRDSSFDIH